MCKKQSNPGLAFTENPGFSSAVRSEEGMFTVSLFNVDKRAWYSQICKTHKFENSWDFSNCMVKFLIRAPVPRSLLVYLFS